MIVLQGRTDQICGSGIKRRRNSLNDCVATESSEGGMIDIEAGKIWWYEAPVSKDLGRMVHPLR